MLKIAEGICTVQGLQTLVSSDPVANLPSGAAARADRAACRQSPGSQIRAGRWRRLRAGSAGQLLCPPTASLGARDGARTGCPRLCPRLCPVGSCPCFTLPGAAGPPAAAVPCASHTPARPTLSHKASSLLSGCPQQALPAISHQQVCLSDPFPEYFQLPWAAMLWVH